MNTTPSWVTTPVLFLPADSDTTRCPASGPATSRARGAGAADGHTSTTPADVRHEEWAAPAAIATACGRLMSACPWWKRRASVPTGSAAAAAAAMAAV
jgi:hypothetical protein